MTDLIFETDENGNTIPSKALKALFAGTAAPQGEATVQTSDGKTIPAKDAVFIITTNKSIGQIEPPSGDDSPIMKRLKNFPLEKLNFSKKP